MYTSLVGSILNCAVRAAFVWTCTAPLPLHSQRPPIPTRALDSVVVRAREGTALAFDLTPDGRTIIFDLLGQLWRLQVNGGTAIPLTHAVRDTADDSDPSVSPNGEWVVFRSDRSMGRGLWLLSLTNGTIRQLTDSAMYGDDHTVPSWSPDSRRVAYVRNWRVHVRDIVTNEDRELAPDGLPRFVTDPAWSRDGKRILVAVARPGRLWEVDLGTNRATRFDDDTTRVFGAVYSPNESRLAYFSYRDSSLRFRLSVRGRGDVTARVLANGGDISNLRVRWSPDGRWVYYVSDGKLWRVGADGGSPAQIRFEATLAFERPQYPRLTKQLPKPGQVLPARGFSGLAIAPDARRYAMIALGKLWIAEIGTRPRELRAVSATARGLSWSPDGNEVGWSAGRGGTENLYATNVNTGVTRQLTSLPGTETLASWSPDGRFIAFVHWAKPELADAPWAPDTIGSRIRIIREDLSRPALLADARDLGGFAAGDAFGHDRLSWNSSSSAILAFSTQGWAVATRDSTRATWLGLDGTKHSIATFPYRPSFVHARSDGSLTYVEDGLLWEMSESGRRHVLSQTPALHPSVAADGTVLFASDSGLRVRRPNTTEEHIGWPIELRLSGPPPPLLIRNARVIDGSGAPPKGLSDILVEHGRVSRLARAGSLESGGVVEALDVEGRTVIPGLIDVHTHVSDPSVLPAALYFGVTTARELGGAAARVADLRNQVLDGVTAGPLLVTSGFRFYPSPTNGGLTGDMEWMPRDSATMERGLALVRGLGAEHVKMRFPKTFFAGAMLVRLARSKGLSISGHCANSLPLVIAGISGQEHLDGQCDERSGALGYRDRYHLFQATGMWGVPTVFGHGAHLLAARDTAVAHDPELEPFVTPQLRLGMLSDPPDPRWALIRSRQRENARLGTRRFYDAGLSVALGTDNPAFPNGVHGELAELVAAGLAPRDALVAATSGAARVLGVDADVGDIAPGKVADFIVLDGDPLIDIRNTRRIWCVIQGGRVVNRDALRQIARAPE